MYFLAQNRHKPNALSVQLTVNKRKYNNDLDPSLGKGVPLLRIRGALGWCKSVLGAIAPLDTLFAAEVSPFGNDISCMFALF
jgi:hypothetical protein